jgi:endonuclease III-like uncharacterized protein
MFMKGQQMKVKLERIPSIPIDEFADMHGFDIIVKERLTSDISARFYASFSTTVEIKERSTLSSAFGNGKTPYEAIVAYAERISNKTLVVDAYKSTRKEIQTPIITKPKNRIEGIYNG